jgi:hypothetical protein
LRWKDTFTAIPTANDKWELIKCGGIVPFRLVRLRLEMVAIDYCPKLQRQDTSLFNNATTNGPYIVIKTL